MSPRVLPTRRLAALLAITGALLMPAPGLAQAAPASAEPPAAPVRDLLGLWRAAQTEDATIRSAQAAAEAGRQRVPQARAALLPSVSLSATQFANERRSTLVAAAGSSKVTEHYDSSLQTLTLRQGLYRPQQRAQLALAQAQEAQSDARYARELQTLSTRVAEAYFEALLAEDQLVLVQVQQSSAETQLDAARKALAAGTGLRTDIDEAQARLDLIGAQALEARQQQASALQQLAALVTQPVLRIAPLDAARFEPVATEPLADWLARAEDASPELAALRAQRDAAEQVLARADADHKPTLDLVAQLQRSNRQLANRPDDRYSTGQIGLQLNVPLYSGGGLQAAQRQAAAELTQATEGLEAARRELGLRVAREWRGVTEGAARVAALAQAVRSTAQALEANRRSFAAGARSSLDVLQAQELAANAQRDLARARYLHLVSLVRLHALAGQAGEPLITRLNTHLAAAERPS